MTDWAAGSGNPDTTVSWFRRTLFGADDRVAGGGAPADVRLVEALIRERCQLWAAGKADRVRQVDAALRTNGFDGDWSAVLARLDADLTAARERLAAAKAAPAVAAAKAGAWGDGYVHDPRAEHEAQWRIAELEPLRAAVAVWADGDG